VVALGNPGYYALISEVNEQQRILKPDAASTRGGPEPMRNVSLKIDGGGHCGIDAAPRLFERSIPRRSAGRISLSEGGP